VSPGVATPVLGGRHPEVKRLRALLRDAALRRAEGVVVLEGPRVVENALDRRIPLGALYLGPKADVAFAPLVARALHAGARVVELRDTVVERVATTRTPQPVLATAPRPRSLSLADLTGPGPVLVLVGVADPGNAGTLLRSAEASGASGVVSCGGSVDVFAPKVVRASAGSVFGVRVVEADDPVAVLDALGAQRRCFATAAAGGTAPADADLAAPVAIVLGNEARGLPDAVASRVDGTLTIPMAGEVESLNVAVAGSVLLFEAARQRSERSEGAR
jgi:TrmH family RNA methyltransferase